MNVQHALHLGVLLHTMLLTSGHSDRSLKYTDAVTDDVQVSSLLLP